MSGRANVPSFRSCPEAQKQREDGPEDRGRPGGRARRALTAQVCSQKELSLLGNESVEFWCSGPLNGSNRSCNNGPGYSRQARFHRRSWQRSGEFWPTLNADVTSRPRFPTSAQEQRNLPGSRRKPQGALLSHLTDQSVLRQL